MKFNEPILIKIEPKNYCIFEDNLGEILDNIEDVPRDPRFDGHEVIDENNPRFREYCGGRFDWSLLKWPENNKEDVSIKVQLMRLWSTTMYTQLAAELSYTNESESNITVGLTEEEIDVLAKINVKITRGIFNEIGELSDSFMRKKNIKKINI